MSKGSRKISKSHQNQSILYSKFDLSLNTQKFLMIPKFRKKTFQKIHKNSGKNINNPNPI